MEMNSLSNISSPSDEVSKHLPVKEVSTPIHVPPLSSNKAHLHSTNTSTNKNALPPHTPSTIAITEASTSTPTATLTHDKTYNQTTPIGTTIQTTQFDNNNMNNTTPISMSSPLNSLHAIQVPSDEQNNNDQHVDEKNIPNNTVNNHNCDVLIGSHVMKPNYIENELGQSISNMSSMTFHSSGDMDKYNDGKKKKKNGIIETSLDTMDNYVKDEMKYDDMNLNVYVHDNDDNNNEENKSSTLSSTEIQEKDEEINVINVSTQIAHKDIATNKSKEYDDIVTTFSGTLSGNNDSPNKNMESATTIDEIMHVLHESSSPPSNKDPESSFFVKNDKNNPIINNDEETMILLQKKVEMQYNTIQTQREELKRYNDMIKKYRAQIREKNLSLISLEKMNGLTQNVNACTVSSNIGGDDDYQKDCGKSQQYYDREHQHQEQDKENQEQGNKEVEIHVFDELQNSSLIKDLNCELRTYKQIIASLTDENNNYRVREMDHLKSISVLQNEAQVMQQQSVSQSHVKMIENQLEFKKQMVEDLSWKVRTMDETEKEHEYLISDLRQRVLDLEDEVTEGKNEKMMLEKLLKNSREVAASAAKNESRSCSSSCGELDDNEAPEDKVGDFTIAKSLEQELEASKKREQQLRDQLTEIMKLGNDESDMNTIMETLTESQQEAILYLTREVDNLRQKLTDEKQKLDSQMKQSQSYLDLIQSLQNENKSFACVILEHEKLVAKLQEDLSLKSGQNACLKDEIAELEEKVEHLGGTAITLEKDLAKKDEECNGALVKAQDSQKKIEMLKKELELKKAEIKAIRASTPMMDDTVVTIDINGTSGKFSEDEDFSNDESCSGSDFGSGSGSADADVASSRLKVLKKALKKDYEMKMKKFKSQMRKKDELIEEIQMTNNEEINALKNELKLEHFNRISQEALIHQDIENLRTSVRERDHELFVAKRKIQMMIQEQKQGTNWDGGLSDVLINGVGATVDIIESVWSENKQQQTPSSSSSRFGRFSSFNLSSKSFG